MGAQHAISAPEAEPFEPAAFARLLSPFMRPPFAYWEAKRGGREMPTRADLDPLEMRAWLPQTMLLEPLETGDFRVRLVGTDVRERMGLEMTGRLASELPTSPEVMRSVLAEFREVMQGRRPTYNRREHISAITGKPIRFERLLAPLSSDGRRVDMLFGVRRDLVGADEVSFRARPRSP